MLIILYFIVRIIVLGVFDVDIFGGMSEERFTNMMYAACAEAFLEMIIAAGIVSLRDHLKERKVEV